MNHFVNKTFDQNIQVLTNKNIYGYQELLFIQIYIDQYFPFFRLLMILFRKYFNGTRLSSHKRKINFLIESNALNNNQIVSLMILRGSETIKNIRTLLIQDKIQVQSIFGPFMTNALVFEAYHIMFIWSLIMLHVDPFPPSYRLAPGPNLG